MLRIHELWLWERSDGCQHQVPCEKRDQREKKSDSKEEREKNGHEPGTILGKESGREDQDWVTTALCPTLS